jgi:hypothetical protein
MGAGFEEGMMSSSSSANMEDCFADVDDGAAGLTLWREREREREE